MTCLCGHPTAHHADCPLALQPPPPTAVRLREGDPLHFEAAMQAAAMATVPLVYDPATGQVLRGAYRGMSVREAERMEVAHLARSYPHVRSRHATLRPWWRWFRPTPAVLITPSHVLEVLF